MATWNFSRVSTVVASSGFNVRRAARDMLLQQGVRRIVDTDQYQVLRQQLEDHDVDLLICDSEIENGAGHEIVHDIRHQVTGQNPFVMVMSLVDPGEQDAVAGSVSAGSDDLVTKPFSLTDLGERLWSLARRRRSFVVNHDYIGPPRRRRPDTGDKMSKEIEVPNPVHSMATGGSRDELRLEIAAAAMLISELKVHSDALQVARLIRSIVARLRAGETNGAISSRRKRVLDAIDDIGRRTQMIEHPEWPEMHDLMLKAFNRLAATLPSPEPKVVEALLALADAFEMSFDEPEIE